MEQNMEEAVRRRKGEKKLPKPCQQGMAAEVDR